MMPTLSSRPELPGSFPLTPNLSDGYRKELGQRLEPRRLAAGTTLWQEGESGNFLALILKGRLELLKETSFPGRPFVLGVYSAGSLIGEDSFLENLPRQGTVRALEETELLILSRSGYETLENEHPRLANQLLKSLYHLMTVRLKSAQSRLAAIF